MSIKLLNSSPVEENNPDHVLQFIPAKINIKQTEKINIDNYFNNFTVTDEQNFLQNSIRGYPIKGCVFDVPTNYKGVVYQEFRKPLDETTQCSFNVSGVFDKFTYWNYDKMPSANDALQKASDWAGVSNSIHEPVNADDLEEFIKNGKPTLKKE